jgi:integrase
MRAPPCLGGEPRQFTAKRLVRQPLTYFALRSRFDKARELAGVSFQFRDLRAKAATDTGDLAHSQKLLAHKNREMTEHYVRSRLGERVRPLR